MSTPDTPLSAEFTVNGTRVTRLHFRLEREAEGSPRRIRLRFQDDTQELARATLDLEHARHLLGEHNLALVLKQADVRPAAKSVTGRINLADLEPRDILLPDHPAPTDDNSIAPAPRTRGRASPAPTEAARAAPQPPDLTPESPGGPPPAPTTPPPALIPEGVAKRFIQVGNRFYFPDQSLAFTDHGTRLKAETNNSEVIRSLLTIAQARGWEALTVTGAEAFRRQVWQEANRIGIEVHGYEPTEIERAAAQQSLQRNAPGGPATRRDDDRSTRRGQTPASSTQHRPNEQFSGRLIEAAPAHYRFDPHERLSFYVKLRTADGERTLWGMDLERALAESATRVQIGDHVTVEHRGASAVTVKLPKRDAEGNLVGDQTLATHRNAWLIEKPEYFAQRQARAHAFKDGSTAREELVRQHPDLTNAVVSLWLGEQFADKRLEDPKNRQRMVELVKQRLTLALEHGEPIQAPILKQEVAQRLDSLRTPAPPSRTPRERTSSPSAERAMDEPQHTR